MVSKKLLKERQCRKMHFIIAALISNALVFVLLVFLSSEACSSVEFWPMIIILVSISTLKLFL